MANQVSAICSAPHQDMNPVHTINNALICILSLFCGRMNPIDSITISVMCGLDTDCNGATVGSITGAAAGRRSIKGPLADRLNDTVRVAMFGFQEIQMATLAERFLNVWRNVGDYMSSNGNKSS